MPVTEPKNEQKLAKNPLYSVIQRFLRVQADKRTREAKARRDAAAASGAGGPLPPGAEPVMRVFTGKQIKRTAQTRSEESKSYKASKKFEKKFAVLADPGQQG
eukprot:1392672-Alexandrium_andersonii.AAC.1